MIEAKIPAESIMDRPESEELMQETLPPIQTILNVDDPEPEEFTFKREIKQEPLKTFPTDHEANLDPGSSLIKREIKQTDQPATSTQVHADQAEARISEIGRQNFDIYINSTIRYAGAVAPDATLTANFQVDLGGHGQVQHRDRSREDAVREFHDRVIAEVTSPNFARRFQG